ncbi:MAG: hypothetical protein ACRDRX_02215 [Pseudonocardiaceae bacterium]
MIPLIRYTSATMLHSQRYLPPVLLFMAVIGIASSNDSGPILPTYGLSAAALFVCATWFTVALISIDDPIHRAITIVSAKNSGKILLSSISVAVIGCLILAVFGLVLPLLVGTHTVQTVDLVVGIEAELAGAAAGIAIGLLCSRLVIRRQGYSLLVALGLVMGALFARDVSPINSLLRLTASGAESSDLMAPIGVLLAITVAILVFSAIATQFVTTRKD